jgi:Zn-dependent peptidase ImmA (M78 family)/transcriptional regulator with XRE-family HTH domain
MSNSVIIAEQLRAAREALGLPLDEAAERVRVGPDALRDWEQGISQPSTEQLWQLAELYNRRVDFFVKETARPPVEVRFRLSQKRGWQDLALPARRTIAEFEELCRAANELDQLLGARPVVRFREIGVAVNPHGLAQQERVRLGCDSRPVRRPRRTLEEQGIRVFQLPVPENQFAGFSWWHEEYGPCILINARDSPGRRNFTLAHEYGHLLTRESPSVCDLSDIEEERFANKFAAAFLMPGEDVAQQAALRGLSQRGLTRDELRSFAARYAVSAEALAYRLQDLQFISRDSLASLLEELRHLQQFRRQPKAPSWRRRLGDTYVNKALQAFYDDKISLGKLAGYFGLDIRKALDVLEKEKADQPDNS